MRPLQLGEKPRIIGQDATPALNEILKMKFPKEMDEIGEVIVHDGIDIYRPTQENSTDGVFKMDIDIAWCSDLQARRRPKSLRLEALKRGWSLRLVTRCKV